MSTSELFTKHFGDTVAVGLKHPNIEAFFEDLNRECVREDAGNATGEFSIRFDYLETGDKFRFNGDTDICQKTTHNQFTEPNGDTHYISDLRCKVVFNRFIK